MRVLVTGSTGLVGGAIADRLRGEGHEVVGLARRGDGARVDLGDAGAPSALRDLGPCDAVVHAAAAIDHDPAAFAVSQVNCFGTQALIAMAEEWGAAAFVFISGVAVIGRPVHAPVDEGHPTDPPTAYHASKLYGEQLTELARRRGVAACSLRLSAPVGKGMPQGRILPVFVARALAGEPLHVAGLGTRRQDYVDAVDVAAAALDAIELRPGGIFNVAAGRSISNEELARCCVEVLGSSSEVVLGEAPDPEEGVDWDISIERATEELGYEPVRTVEDSIAAIAAS